MTVDVVLKAALLQRGAADSEQASATAGAEFSDILRTSLSSGSVDLDAIFELAGQKYNLSPDLLKAVAKTESNFRPDVVSRAGAMGIMQLMPGTARGLGVTDAFDPYQNIMGGAKYLRQMLDRYNGDLELALAAYNAGPGNVKKYGGVPPFRETQNYIKKVTGLLGGGPITAGTIEYRGSPLTEASKAFSLGSTMTEMLIIKIIEMQMQLNSSNDDNRWSF